MRIAGGQWVQGNWLMAVKCYYKAARHGCADAQSKLGECYEIGMGVEQDDEEAIRWYTEAAIQGNGPALRNLAGYYHMGRAVKKDDELAKALLLVSPDCRKAARQFQEWYGEKLSKPGVYRGSLRAAQGTIQKFIRK